MDNTVYIFAPTFSSFARSVMLCCEEKGIAYTCGMAPEGSAITSKSPEHFAIHPWGKLPALFHEGQVLIETCTICRYLDARFEETPLQPNSIFERARLDQYCAEIALYIDQALLRNIVLEFAFPKGKNGEVRMDQVETALPEARKALERVDEMLGDNDFIHGQSYTLADALLTPILDYLAKVPAGPDLMSNTAASRYLERIRQRPSAKVLSSH